MSVHMRPEEIEAESFRMIDEEVEPHSWPPAEWQIVRRAIHTSADFDYSRTMFMSPDAVACGVAALQGGKAIVTDTNMALSGISRVRMDRFGLSAKCLVAAADAGNGIFVIGNAPTALFELLRLVREDGLRPALIVGMPVGFVGASESKEELVRIAGEYAVPYITNRGRKGGSNVAAAVVNALLILAAG